MTRQDIVQPYVGQYLGTFWSFVNPLVIIVLYAVVFEFVFRFRTNLLDGFEDSNYTQFLLSALIPWLGFVEVLTRSNGDITGNANLVKKVIFPTIVLPVRTALSAGFKSMLGFVFLSIVLVVQLGRIPLSFALFPVAALITLVYMVGAAWFLAALTPFFRDLSNLMTIFVTAGIYVSPIIYPGDPPPVLGPFIDLNPFGYPLLMYRDIFHHHGIETPSAWLISAAFALVTFVVGYSLFNRLRPHFSTVL
ncbi:MAG: ABC transporter permease [Actinomycetota bacterium]